MLGKRKPIALLPLRLEIRHIENSTDGNMVKLAEYSYSDRYDAQGKLINYGFRKKETTKVAFAPKRETWIRWYPDDCQLFPPINKITKKEIVAYNSYLDNINSGWTEFYTVVGLQRARFLLDFFNGKKTIEIIEVDAYNSFLNDSDREKFNMEVGAVRAQELIEIFKNKKIPDVNEIIAYNSFLNDFDQNKFDKLVGRERAQFLIGFFKRNKPPVTFELNAYNTFLDDSDRVKYHGIVGSERAQYLLILFRGKKAPVSEIDPFPETNPSAHTKEKPTTALSQLFTEGARLKALPDKVKLYTITENSITHISKIDFIAEGNAVDANITFASGDQPSSRWIIDFAEAVSKGMGLKITDPDKCDKVLNADWLIAVGHNDESEGLLEELLLRNKTMGRFDIIRQDSPTNNTEDEKSCFIGNEYGTEREQQASIQSPRPINDSAFNNADVLAINLGLNGKVFNGIANGSLFEQEAARAMSQLIWEACTNAYCTYFMKYWPGNPDCFSMSEHMDIWKLLTSHFMSYVFGRGPMPAIQIGKNPYGIVVATDMKKWSSIITDNKNIFLERNINKICKILKNKYLKLAKGSPRIDLSDSTNLFDILIQILQSNAVSYRVDVQVFEDNDLNTPERGLGKDPQRLTCALVSNKEKEDEKLNEIRTCLIFVSNYLNNNMDLPIPTADDKYKDISLLQRLLHYSAVRLKSDEDQRVKMIAAIKFFIQQIDGNTLNAKDFELLILEALDCLSYRLDAWITSMATLRLDELMSCSVPLSFNPHFKKGRYDAERKIVTYKGIMSETERDELKIDRNNEDKLNIDKLFSLSQNNNSIVGVYGWLEKPGAQELRNKSEGYFQAPSMNQAITGSILRSAALSEKNNEQNPFQVNMSSQRVRKAMWFIEGLQKGYRPSELLGYEVERKMHDRGIDKYLLDMRKQYPLAGQTEYEMIKNSRIIDGEKFVESDNETFILDADKATINKIRSEINQIRDSVSDLYIAEILYQTIQDKTARTNAWLEAVEGKNIPPTPEVMRTPRTGHPQAQRIVYPLSKIYTDTPIDNIENPRIIAEPFIAKYIDSYIDGFRRSIFQAIITSRNEDNGGSNSIDISPINNLNMAAIDFAVGGLAEMEKCARVYIWNKLLEERNLWRMQKNVFPDNLMQLLIKYRIVVLDKDDNNYIFFEDSITTEDKLICRLIQDDIIDSDREKVLNKWRDTQKWKFLGRDFLVDPTPIEFDNLVFITFDYGYTNGDDNALNYYDNKAKSLHLFLKNNQPLCPEDIIIPEEINRETIIDEKLTGYLLLKTRAKRLLDVLHNVRQELFNVKDTFTNDISNLQKIFMKISKFGFPEALVNLPFVINDNEKRIVLTAIIELVNILNGSENDKTSIKDLIDKLNNSLNVSKEIEDKIRNLNESEDVKIKIINLVRRICESPSIKTTIEETVRNLIETENVKTSIMDLVNILSETQNIIINIGNLVRITNESEDTKNRIMNKIIEFKNRLDEAGNVRNNITDLLSKIDKAERELDLNRANIIFDINGTETKIQITNDGKIKKDTGEFITDSGIKAAAIDKFIKEAISLLQKRSLGDAMPIFPPFKMQNKFDISEPNENQNLINWNNMKVYAKVRNKIAQLIEILPSTTKIFSDITFQKSVDEALLQGMLSQGLNPDTVDKNSINIPDPWRQSGMDIHYILSEGKLNISENQTVVGFKIDEWTDFIPNMEETTGIAFQYDTPQAEAPQAIILAVPPNISSNAWSDDDLAEIIAQTIDLMQIRPISGEDVVGSNLGVFLPALFFDNYLVDKDWKCRFPSSGLNLYNGIIKGGFHYVKENDPSVHLYSGPSAQREL